MTSAKTSSPQYPSEWDRIKKIDFIQDITAAIRSPFSWAGCAATFLFLLPSVTVEMRDETFYLFLVSVGFLTIAEIGVPALIEEERESDIRKKLIEWRKKS